MDDWNNLAGWQRAIGVIAVSDGTKLVGLPVGTDGKVLTADAAQPTGVKWATPAATGVTTVTAADASLTITPNAGAVTAKINEAHQNDWTAIQTVTVGSVVVTIGGGGFTGLAIAGTNITVNIGVSGTYAGSFNDAANSVVLCSGTFAVDATAGTVTVVGVHGTTFEWVNDHVAPVTPQTVVLPTSVYGQGTITHLLGDPDKWLLVQINGVDYLIPAYLTT